MRPQPTSEEEWIIHSINIHGVFFERWCQRVVADSAGWTVVAANYPVEYPPPSGPIRGRESSLDIRADREYPTAKLSLIIECKKNNPELANWVFFPAVATGDDWFTVSINQAIVAPPPATNWNVTSGLRGMAASAVLTDEARETRGDYLQTRTNIKTKTSNAAISDASFQVALAKQAIVAEEARFENAIGASATTPKAGPHSHIFVPVIVTTANLFTCKFDPLDVDPHTGEIPFANAQLQPRSRLVYQYGIPKQLQNVPSDLAGTLSDGQLARFTRMHIVVVHSSDFANFLASHFQ